MYPTSAPFYLPSTNDRRIPTLFLSMHYMYSVLVLPICQYIEKNTKNCPYYLSFDEESIALLIHLTKCYYK